MRQWRIRLDRRGGRGPVFPVGATLSIGRSEDCDVRPRSRYVSWTHCTLRTDGDRLLIRDAGSRHGTFVNGIQVKDDRELVPDDRIMVGPLRFVVEQGTAPPPWSGEPDRDLILDPPDRAE